MRSGAMSNLPQLDTARTRLRALTLDDAPAIHRMWTDPETMRFWDFPPSRDLEETTAQLARSLGVSDDWHAVWCVVLRASGEVIGLVNFHHREPWNRRLEIGYMLARPWWGRGLMSEALGAFLDHCFDALQAHRIEASIDPANTASVRLAERLGFRRESGILRQRLLVAGEFRDQVMFGLLAPDWRARKRLTTSA